MTLGDEGNGDLAPIFVVAVMATMNRSAVPAKCVQALALQTRAPNRVIVADNVSVDDTVEVLQRLEGLPFDLTVHPMAKNRGNAGGVEEAMNLAFREGADAVWILDDDSWPRATALEGLLRDHWQPDVIRHSIQVDPKTHLLTWPLPVDDENGGWKLIWSVSDLPHPNILHTKASWTGALIPKKVYDSVGPVNGELFIRGEDEEYPWRIEQAGFRFEGVKSSVMDHPGPANLIQWRFWGRSLFLERSLPDVKLYYKVRNMVWLKRKQSGIVEAVLISLAYFGGIVVIDGPSRIPMLVHATLDGWRGRLGILQK